MRKIIHGKDDFHSYVLCDTKSVTRKLNRPPFCPLGQAAQSSHACTTKRSSLPEQGGCIWTWAGLIPELCPGTGWQSGSLPGPEACQGVC